MGAGVFYRIFCIVLGTLALGRLAFAQTTSVEVPCKAANTPPTACKLFSSPCATTIQSVIEDLDKSIQNKLDGFARGKDLSLFEMDSNGQPLESPTSPACELAAIPPEITQNRFGVQCGTQARITMNGPDLTNDPGGNSYKIGVKSTAIRCFWNTVKAELQAQGKINNIPTSCQGLADDVNAVIAQSNSAWNQLLAREGGPAGTNNLCSAKMIRDFQNEVPEACRDDRAPASEEEVAQVVNQRQGACFLAAARGALYTAVKRLTLCTVFKNAESSWRKLYDGEPSPFDTMMDASYTPSVVNAARQAARSCRPIPRASCVRNRASNGATNYHRDNFWNWYLNQFILMKYPRNAPQGGACSPP